MTSDVVYIRPMDPPATPDDVQSHAREAGGCFELHRVDWIRSFLARDGSRMMCWYRAPDAESARQALRQLGSDLSAAWPATTIGGDDNEGSAVDSVNVVVELTPDSDSGDLARRLSDSRLLEPHGVACVLGFLATGRSRAACLYRAPEAAAVHDALTAAGLTPESIWPCTPITPGLAPARPKSPPK